MPNSMPISRDARIGVVGAGAMGSGIAQIAAASGHPVVVVDSNSAALARGASGFERAIQREVEKKRMDSAAGAAAIARVQWHHASGSPGLGALAGCDFVIEAVVETLTVKRDLFIQLEARGEGRLRARDQHLIAGDRRRSRPPVRIPSACWGSTSSIRRPSCRSWRSFRGSGPRPA